MKPLNPKLQKPADKWFVIDAPEIIDRTNPKIKGPVLTEMIREQYQESLSKAPRWEVKNQEEVQLRVWDETDDNNFKDWQPDPTKLYDIPDGFRIALDCGCDKFDCNCTEYFAILIPEEEVNEQPNIKSAFIKDILGIIYGARCKPDELITEWEIELIKLFEGYSITKNK